MKIETIRKIYLDRDEMKLFEDFSALIDKMDYLINDDTDYMHDLLQELSSNMENVLSEIDDPE